MPRKNRRHDGPDGEHDYLLQLPPNERARTNWNGFGVGRVVLPETVVLQDEAFPPNRARLTRRQSRVLYLVEPDDPESKLSSEQIPRDHRDIGRRRRQLLDEAGIDKRQADATVRMRVIGRRALPISDKPGAALDMRLVVRDEQIDRRFPDGQVTAEKRALVRTTRIDRHTGEVLPTGVTPEHDIHWGFYDPAAVTDQPTELTRGVKGLRNFVRLGPIRIVPRGPFGPIVE